MERPAEFSVVEADGGRRAVLSGDWTATAAGDAVSRLVAAVQGEQLSGIDLTPIRRLDTAGAYGILRALADHPAADRIEARPETHRLLELVAAAARNNPDKRQEPRGFYELAIRTGRGVFNLGTEIFETMVSSAARSPTRPVSAGPRASRWPNAPGSTPSRSSPSPRSSSALSSDCWAPTCCGSLGPRCSRSS